ncbi:hypothetical protein K492DRAFT_189462 [Lichtheimia hyalospora FSU 10163]|nr:hypothetical protein K492DRAFT_189462 [Lichtheimia hyalospora FSU 10163]
MQRIAWYGSAPLLLGLYILSFSQDYKTAIRDFCHTYAALGLLLTVINVGVIIEILPSATIAARILDTLVMSLALILICACAPRWVGMKHDRLANQSGDEEDNLFGHDHTQETDNIYNNTSNNHDSRYDPDDVYTKEAQDIGRF